MHYYKSSNEIMQYCIFSNDIALIMHYRALLKRSGTLLYSSEQFLMMPKSDQLMCFAVLPGPSNHGFILEIKYNCAIFPHI